MIRHPFFIIVVAIGLLTGLSRPAVAEEGRPRAAFALIVGSNTSVDSELTPLRYADDDAARYFDMFRALGMRTTILARLDDSTRKLHPQAAIEAQSPRRAELTRATLSLAADIALARQRGFDTVLYFVFAGHGGTRDGRGYVALEDARLTGEILGEEIVSRVGAGAVHIILDACNSYLVAYTRGPGGARRSAGGFVQGVYELGRDPRVGLLLSTSSATESHEWDAFQAGVFSHEVRSGLHGAADADGDGNVSYRELASFVARANEAIENERYRPQIFARAPSNGDALLDLRSARAQRVTIDGAHAGRYLLEDARGVRLADFHSKSGQSIALIRPSTGRAYLRRLDVDTEFVLEDESGAITVAYLTASSPRTSARGALHESFSKLFSMPFDRDAVAAYVPPPPVERPAPPVTSVRKIVGLSLLGAGALGLGAGTYFTIRAAGEPHAEANETQIDVAARNSRVSDLSRAATWSFVGGGLTAGAGALLLLWPSGTGLVRASASASGGFVQYGTSF